jgi:hypothetical protein
MNFSTSVRRGWCAGLLAALAGGAAHAQGELLADTWAATDALGRSLPVAEQVGAPRTNRTVGIFYFLWHQTWSKYGPYDVSRILAADPDARQKPDTAGWGPPGVPHYWGEPLFGYYRNDDPWVLRKHAQLLANAGVDTLIFDTTNAAIYREMFLKLCKVFEQARRDGVRAPQICFMVNTKAGATARNIYEALYKPGLHRDLWFQWQGKPLLLCDPKEADPELRAFFTLRAAHWPFTLVNTQDAWHWEATYPQPYGYTTDPQKPEQVNVSVAQNLRASDGKVTNMSDGNARGRGFHDGRQDASRAAIDRGANCEEQWRRALQLDPPFVMVTGWNEWIAGRFTHGGALTFVDQYNEEFSRDIEPMKGGHGDNYYYQLVANIRRYKGARPPPPVQPQPIAIDGRFDDWAAVQPEFRDPPGDALPRAFPGIGHSGAYTNLTGRNDLVAAKVSVDTTNVYFHIRTAAKLTPPTDPNWMLLFIDAGGRADTGWLGFDFVVGRGGARNGRTSLEKNTGGYHWSHVADVPCAIGEKEIELAIPRTALGVRTLPAEIRFKWSDNIQQTGDASDFTLNGDSAPDDRFAYRALLPALPGRGK